MTWRRSKFGAVRTEVDGIKFASKAEAARWIELKRLEAAGEIRRLRRQVRYDLHARNGGKVGAYVADYVYERKVGSDWGEVVEDVKGVETPMFRRNAKHMAQEHGISIEVVRPRSRA